MNSENEETPSGPFAVASCDVRMPPSVKPSFRTRLFYPTTAAFDVPCAEYFPPATTYYPNRNMLSIFKFVGVPFPKIPALFLSFVSYLPIPSQSKGELLPLPTSFANGYPVMILSHGLGGSTAVYSNFCIEMASHGYFVAAPEHTDGSASEAVVDDDNTYIPFRKYNSSTDGSISEFRKPQLEIRRQNITDLLTALHTLSYNNESNDKNINFCPLRSSCPVPNLRGMLDFSNVVMAGHSYGASTALLSVLDGLPNFCSIPKAIICLDAWLTPIQEILDTAQLPRETNLLFIDMSESGLIENLNRIRKPLIREDGISEDGETILDAVQVIGGTHQNSSDIALRVPKFVAVLTKTTLKGSNPLQILQAQSNAAVNFLKGTQNWKTFRVNIINQQVDLLKLA